MIYQFKVRAGLASQLAWGAQIFLATSQPPCLLCSVAAGPSMHKEGGLIPAWFAALVARRMAAQQLRQLRALHAAASIVATRIATKLHYATCASRA
jgi:hypothetical protein